ncbi:type II secretion system F family protein [Thiomicrorhabdus sp. 6S2-11]|uniref:Type II secretion system F family protein n=1 Tax=Thiomicrorhabdus marina TaxID=2818442 RepID=A0ABS3Q5Q8_9GAMM|nr:type II secretion system F family protein [Thiomicrorhabdus marina]MBO1927680.1 type II secretion system F family protein [Thiomicrorhabdus marina]
MDWELAVISSLVLLPFVFIALGLMRGRQRKYDAKVRSVMLRIGMAEEERLSLEELLMTQKNKGWFQFFVVKFKQAGIIGRQEIIRLILIQAFLLTLTLLLLAFNLGELSKRVLLLILILPTLPTVYLFVKAAQRQAQLRKEFPEMLDSLVRSMQAGYGIDGALRVVAEDMSGPLAEEIEEMNKQLKLGISLRDILREFQARVSLIEAQYFVITLILQRESGGQLSPVLKQLGLLMRRRENFQAKLQTLTAESRFTAWFISGLPILYVLYKFIFDIGSMDFLLHDPTGVKILAISLGLIFTGALILRSMLRIRF